MASAPMPASKASSPYSSKSVVVFVFTQDISVVQGRIAGIGDDVRDAV